MKQIDKMLDKVKNFKEYGMLNFIDCMDNGQALLKITLHSKNFGENKTLDYTLPSVDEALAMVNSIAVEYNAKEITTIIDDMTRFDADE